MKNKEKLPKSNDWITVTGAKEHNLKNIDVAIPKGTFTVITGPSGSGKSSLALDILYTEGKRRYVESLSSYARQFLGVAKKPDVERIDGLCPAIAIEQKTVGHNPRSTVGTITEIYDYLRVLFARIGQIHCPECHSPIKAESPQAITQMILTTFHGNTITIAAPTVNAKKGEFTQELFKLFKAGYYRFVIDGIAHRFSSEDDVKNLKLKKTHAHTIDVLIDVLEVQPAVQSRIQEALERACAIASGACKVIAGQNQHTYSTQRMCVSCAVSVPEIEPRLFSFNNPIGACKACHGLGMHYTWHSTDEDDVTSNTVCGTCYGQRLNSLALSVTVDGKTIYEWSALAVSDLLTAVRTLSLTQAERDIAHSILVQMENRLTFLDNVGLSYISLSRTARTLSGGEGQRIRLATQIGSALSGVLYILDEPSIGLHQRDNDRLIATLKALRDQGNTVVVVEHDTDTMAESDYLIDMGPAAGVLGGQVVATGTPQEVARNPLSLTGAYLSGKRVIAVPDKVRTPQGFLTLANARKNNLKNLMVRIPLRVMCGISGVSGSGKSTLVMQEIVPAVTSALTRRSGVIHDTIQGTQQLENIVVIDQTPIGRTPRSNPATYLGIFDDIRRLYASLPESNVRGYTVSRFSFNVAEGRCFECNGDGSITVTMHFLPEVTLVCKACAGKRYNAETLKVMYRGKTIADVLAMTALQAREFFAAHASIAKRLKLMCDVGLDYIALGQPSTTLSGGEAQRIKLVNELAKRGSDTLYILDEPTTGLHASDIEKLLQVLNTLVDKGNSMIIIEHNLDVLKATDYIIDLGPEGGNAGGTIVAQGTPRQVAESEKSHTGYYLKRLLKDK